MVLGYSTVDVDFSCSDTTRAALLVYAPVNYAAFSLPIITATVQPFLRQKSHVPTLPVKFSRSQMP